MMSWLSMLTGNGPFDDTMRLPAVAQLIQARSFDSATGLYECANGTGLLLEVLPLVGLDAAGIETLKSCFLELDLGPDSTFQVVRWASPHIGPIVERWATNREADTTGLSAGRAQMLRDMAADGRARWRPRHFRIFVSLVLPSSRTGRNISVLEQARAGYAYLQPDGHAMPDCAAGGLLGLYSGWLFPDLSTDPQTASWSEFEPLCDQSGTGASFAVNFKQIEWDNGLQARSFCQPQAADEWPPGMVGLLGDLFNPYLICGWPMLQTVTLTTAAMSKDIAGMARVEAKSFTVAASCS